MIAHTVLLYGQSLLLSLVAAGLAQCPELHLLHATTWAEACQLLADTVPDVLVFELTDSSENRFLPLLLKNPRLLLVGLDPEHDQALQFSIRETTSLNMAKIRSIIGGRR